MRCRARAADEYFPANKLRVANRGMWQSWPLTTWELSITPKIPEISVRIQMEKSISVSSDRNIRDHLWRWSTYFGWNIPTEIRRPILSPN